MPEKHGKIRHRRGRSSLELALKTAVSLVVMSYIVYDIAGYIKPSSAGVDAAAVVTSVRHETH